MRLAIHLLAGLLTAYDGYNRYLQPPPQSGVGAWVAQEEAIARAALFRNIGPRGEFAQGSNAGAVIASPSTSAPDYYFQWTRDSALVFKVLLNQYLAGNASLETFLRDYAAESDRLQHTPNPSGGYSSGGLGEPKFHDDGRAFTGSWGRPQTDGPAIRATVLAKFANSLLDAGGQARQDYVTSTLYSAHYPPTTVVKSDLDYVANNWQARSFDLWEEIDSGLHFFNLMVQQRALTDGAALATRLNDSGAAAWYRQQAAAIRARLPAFWDAARGHLVSTLGNTGRNGLDCGILLGSLHGNGAGAATAGAAIFPPSSGEVLATAQRLVDAFHSLYPINANANASLGIAIGRYPNDVYDGVGKSVAHPWFICTFTVAETLFTALNEFSARRAIDVSTASQPFFRQFWATATAGQSHAYGSAAYDAIAAGMRAYADSFLARTQHHAMTNGSLSEQFSRFDGYQKGARDLTWSYASFLTTKWARDGATAY